jgi:hypoxanthine phosphoribosyltransferase
VDSVSDSGESIPEAVRELIEAEEEKNEENLVINRVPVRDRR